MFKKFNVHFSADDFTGSDFVGAPFGDAKQAIAAAESRADLDAKLRKFDAGGMDAGDISAALDRMREISKRAQAGK